MAAQWSSTWSQSRTCRPSPYSGSGSPSSAFVTNSGSTFSGYWLGPYVFEPRVIDAFTANVRTVASTCRSPPAFEALYGLDGMSVSSSFEDEPGSTSPYTSSVDTCTYRAPTADACWRRTYVPRTSVSMNSAAPKIERSTWVSAAKLTIASQPSAAVATASRSAMSLWTNSTSAPSRFARLPEYVSLSRTTTRSPAAARRFAKCDPMKPAPPVTRIRIGRSLDRGDNHQCGRTCEREPDRGDDPCGGITQGESADDPGRRSGREPDCAQACYHVSAIRADADVEAVLRVRLVCPVSEPDGEQ